MTKLPIRIENQIKELAVTAGEKSVARVFYRTAYLGERQRAIEYLRRLGWTEEHIRSFLEWKKS